MNSTRRDKVRMFDTLTENSGLSVDEECAHLVVCCFVRKAFAPRVSYASYIDRSSEILT